MNDVMVALCVAGGLTAAIWPTGVVTRGGAVAGFVLTFVVMFLGGEPALAAFALLVILGSAVARIGYRRKQALGVEQSRGGRRGASHALANGGPGVLLLFVLHSPGPLALIVAAASFGSALSDTVSSEIGTLSRETPRLLLLGPRRAAGVDGAMTWLGSAAGLVAAAVVALAAGGLARCTVAQMGMIAAGAFAGNLVDSLLGATVQRFLPKRHANEIVNALAALAGGICALLIWIGSGG